LLLRFLKALGKTFMQNRLLSDHEFGALYRELRDPDQVVLPDGSAAIHVGRHPIFGRLATVHDGERIALVIQEHPALLCPASVATR
jgi:hypothetical protein